MRTLKPSGLHAVNASRRGTLTLLALTVFAIGSAFAKGNLRAQDTTADPATAEEGDAANDDADGRLVVREKTVYVPYRDLRKVFEKEGRGIFLPYEEFLELWKKSNTEDPPPPPDDPPADSVLRAGSYKGEVVGDIARFEVEYEVESLAKGWTELALPLVGVAVEGVDLGDSGALLTAVDGGYRLLLPAQGKARVALTFSVRITSSPGRKTLSFGLPPAAVSSVELSIPETDARVDVEPRTAAVRSEEVEGATKLSAWIGNSDRVAVHWMPPAGKEGETDAVLIAEQYVRADLGERNLRLATRMVFRVARGEVSSFRIRVPTDEGTQLLSVRGDNIREWNQEGDLLQISLHAPVTDAYELALSFQRVLEETPESIAIGLPRADGVLRESGWLAVGHDASLETSVGSAPGLSQLDPDEVPTSLRQDLRLAFRYLAPPEPLVLDVETITPLIRSSTTSVVTLGRERDLWVGFIDYDIQRTGVFRLALSIPERWIVEEIGDERHQVSEPVDGRREITIDLRTRKLGALRVPFRFSTTAGSAQAGDVGLDPLVVLGTESDRGLFGVTAPRAIEMITVDKTRMSSVDYQELYRSGIMGQVSAEADPLAYSYNQASDEKASLALRLENRQEEVRVLAQHLVEVFETGRMRITHFLDYEVLYKEVEALEFSAPTTLDSALQLQPSRDYKEHSIVSRADGVSRWQVTLQGLTLGTVSLVVVHELGTDDLAAGVAKLVSIPLVVPGANVYTTREGFVAVRETGKLEIVPETTMDPVDPQSLPDRLRRPDVLSAYSYLETDKSLALRVTRYDPVHLARTVVNLHHVQAVLSEDPLKLTARATLLVRNTDAQYLEIQLPLGAKTRSVHVDGKRETTQRRQNSETELIAIPRTPADGQPTAIRVEYDHTLGDALGTLGRVGLGLIEIVEQTEQPIPVEKTELDLWVPRDWSWLSWDGSLRRHALDDVSFVAQVAEWLTDKTARASSVRRQEGDPAPQAGGDIRFDRLQEGRQLRRFTSMARQADLRGTYCRPGVFVASAVLAFLLVLAGGALLLRRVSSGKGWLLLALLVVPLVLAWFLRDGYASIAWAATLGAVALAVLLLLRAVGARIESWRTRRLQLAPDPYLEEAQPAPSRDADEAAPNPQAPKEESSERPDTECVDPRDASADEPEEGER